MTMHPDYAPSHDASANRSASIEALEPAAAAATVDRPAQRRAFSDGHELRAAVAARTVPVDFGVVVVFAEGGRARIYADPVMAAGTEVREALQNLKDDGVDIRFDSFRNCHVANARQLSGWLSSQKGNTCQAVAAVLQKGANRF